MARCEICGKGPQFGHNVSHAANKTKRRWRPNVQQYTVYRDGRPVRMHLCRKCIRTLNKQAALG